MGFLFVSVVCIIVGLVVPSYCRKLPDCLRTFVSLMALVGVLMLLMTPSECDSVIINNADAAMAKFEAGEMRTNSDYEGAMRMIDKYNETILKAKEYAGNWWNGRLLRKFEDRELMELPEEFYTEYVNLLRHRTE